MIITTEAKKRGELEEHVASCCLREFGCKLPASLPSCVREGGSGSGVGVERHPGTWGPSRSIVFFGD